MNKLIAAATIAASAVFSTSSLWAVTYEASDERPSYIVTDENGSVVFDRDDTSGAITNLVLAPNNGATLVLDGDTLDFAAGAKIFPALGGEIGGLSIISNSFTTAGALEFVGVTNGIVWNGGNTYLPNTSANPNYAAILNNVNLADLVPVSGGGKAGNTNVSNYNAFFPEHLDDGTLLFELQRYNNNNSSPNTRGALIALKKFGNEIRAKWLAGGFKSNLTTEGTEHLFEYAAADGTRSWDNGTARAKTGVTTTSAYNNAKINSLVFNGHSGTSRIVFAVAGDVTLPAVSGNAVEVTFDANAFGELAEEFKSGIFANNSNWQTLTTDYELKDIEIRSGRLYGSYLYKTYPEGVDAIAFGWTNNNEYAGCQMQQLEDNLIRTVDLEFRQNGNTVEVRWIRNIYTYVNASTYYGKKYLTTSDPNVTLATVTNIRAYWVSTKPLGAVAAITVSGLNTMKDCTYVFRGDTYHPMKVSASLRGALPPAVSAYGSVDIVAAVSGSWDNGVLDQSAITLHNGATIHQEKTYLYGYPHQLLTLDAAEFIATDNTSYLTHLVMTNGATISGGDIGGRMDSGYTSNAKWRITGEGASTCDANIRLMGLGSEVRELIFEVEDTADGPDFLMSGDIYQTNAGNYQHGRFAKTGAGTMLMNGSIIARTGDPARIAEGTLILGKSGCTTVSEDALVTAPSMDLEGGTLALAAGTSNEVATVSVTTNSMLSVGTGASLTMTNVSVAEGQTLTIECVDGTHAKSLKVNTLIDGATLSRIRLNGRRPCQTSDGYLYIGGFMMIVR